MNVQTNRLHAIEKRRGSDFLLYQVEKKDPCIESRNRAEYAYVITAITLGLA